MLLHYFLNIRRTSVKNRAFVYHSKVCSTVRLPSQGLDQAVILSNAFLIDTVQQQEKLNIDFTRFIC